MKFGKPRRRGLVGEDARVELLRQPLPVATLHLISKVEPLVVHLDAEAHAPASRNRKRRREHIGLDLVRQARHHAHVFADRLVMRDVEIVELRAVVVADESGHLLEVLRLELDDGAGAVAVRLLASRDECLAELAADASRDHRDANDRGAPSG